MTTYGFVNVSGEAHERIDSFTESLKDALLQIRDTATVVSSDANRADTVRTLNSTDVVIVQYDCARVSNDIHDATKLMDQLSVPSILVLHSLGSNQSDRQRAELTSVCDSASVIVTTTSSARSQLIETLVIDPNKIRVIAQGASAGLTLSIRPRSYSRPVVLTWGTLRPHHGVEWGIEAMALLKDVRPAPVYVIANPTQHGSGADAEVAREYSALLHATVDRLDLRHIVYFVDEDLPTDEVHKLIRSASVVLLPYDFTENSGSFVLAQAIAALRPVVATPFPHATELLRDGAGVLVPQHDAQGLADAVRDIIQHPEVAEAMARSAAAAAPQLIWSTVADHYRELAAELLDTPIAV